MSLYEYIRDNYKYSHYWFEEEVKRFDNVKRVNDIIDIREYLSGKHKILTRPVEKYQGKDFYPRKIVLQYAKVLLNFQVAYLLQHPITLTGAENVINIFKEVYKKGKYNRIDFKVLSKMVKYGNCYEYLFLDGNKGIKSKLINPEDGFPVFNQHNEYLSFIESYTVDGITYYIIYYPDFVEKFDNEEGNIRKTGEYNNLSGLPVIYANENELDQNYGRSDLKDYISILDSMEDLISKFTDSFYKHHNPIPVSIGQIIKGEGINPDLVGSGIVIEDGSDFKMVQNQLDVRSFKEIYGTLKQALLDISSTPAISFNATDVSNLSEVSIKLLFSLADIKAGLNEQYIREGMEQRFEQMRKLLEYKGVSIADKDFDSLGVVFAYARPQNEKDIIDNLKTLKDISGISTESLLEHSPYTVDVTQELERLKGDGSNTN